MSSWLHRVLGLNNTASHESIRTSYRTLLKQYHPDLCANTIENQRRLKLVRLAYEVLQDESFAALHEKTGEIPDGVAVDPELREWLSQSGLMNVAKGFFKGFRMERPEHGRSFRKKVVLTLKELLHGTSRIIDVKRTSPCSSCTGSGSAPSPPPMRCHVCSGAGTVSWKKKWNVAMQCPFCAGHGLVIRVPCSDCSGDGFTHVNDLVQIKFSAGIQDGTEVILKGEGERGKRGGRHGDLILVTQMEEGTGFVRLGVDLEIGVPVPHDAKAVSIPHPDGDLRLTVPPQKESVVVVKGKGLPSPTEDELQGDLRVLFTRQSAP